MSQIFGAQQLLVQRFTDATMLAERILGCTQTSTELRSFAWFYMVGFTMFYIDLPFYPFASLSVASTFPICTSCSAHLCWIQIVVF